MSTTIRIVSGPLPTAAPPWKPAASAGALLTFEGIARPVEDGRPIDALDYEAYEPMASNLLKKLGQEMLEKHGVIALCVEHSTGRVRAGECSFRLRVAAFHRAEALAAANEFITRMKQDVPIWKTPIFSRPTLASGIGRCASSE